MNKEEKLENKNLSNGTNQQNHKREEQHPIADNKYLK